MRFVSHWVGTRSVLPRRSRSSIIRIPELHPSSGLAWSRKAFPQQYEESNWKAVELVGFEDYENERFLDIAGRAYSRRFLSQFSYMGPDAKLPRVHIEYLRRAETFVGRLSAQGLKPNFAYQIKLRGLFSHRTAFERIGYLGRWRLPGRPTNYLDKAYEKFPDKQLVESYLLFDFMATDPQGNARKEFYADSTLHVLWNATTQRTPRYGDACPIKAPREGSPPSLYANPRVDLSAQRIYAQSEENALAQANRPGIGRAFLPPGNYKAELVLVEESFHGYGDNGYWPTVMVCPVEFEVIEQPRPSSSSPYWSATVPVKVPLLLEQASTEDIDNVKLTAGSLEGVATSERPAVVFAEEIEFAPGERYVLAANILASGTHTWHIFIDDGSGFDEKPTYAVSSEGRRGWQRFEVEITTAVAGKTVHIRLLPTTKPGSVGVRSVGAYKIAAPHLNPLP